MILKFCDLLKDVVCLILEVDFFDIFFDLVDFLLEKFEG